MKKIIKYHGEFKDLIPRGWRFQKLYANNYRCYIYEFDLNNHLWLWQAGRELEIQDLHSSSWLLLDWIVNKNIEDARFMTKSKYINGKWKRLSKPVGLDWFNFCFDQEKNELIPYVAHIHDPTVYTLVNNIDTKSQEFKDVCDSLYKKFRRFSILEESVNYIKGMYDRNLLSIEEDS